MSQTTNINELFQSAQDEGLLSQQAMVNLNIPDIGQQINDAMGVSVDDVTASEVILVTMLIDDSGSIRFAGNSEAVRDGHNLVVESLEATKQKDNILIHTVYLNGSILFPFRSLEHAVKMDSSNYSPDKGTPLYDAVQTTLATVLAKSQEFSDNGVPCRTVTLIVTDGADMHSVRMRAPEDLKPIVEDMLRTENHIIAGMGFDDGSSLVDFRNIFKGMGVPDQWILDKNHNESDIRKAFALFSQSAVRASQGGAVFSQAAIGGFGN